MGSDQPETLAVTTENLANNDHKRPLFLDHPRPDLVDSLERSRLQSPSRERPRSCNLAKREMEPTGIPHRGNSHHEWIRVMFELWASTTHFGVFNMQQCFEGLKAFRGKDGKIRIFRPNENALRLAHSARMICLPPVSEELFLEAVHLAYVPSSVLMKGLRRMQSLCRLMDLVRVCIFVRCCSELEPNWDLHPRRNLLLLSLSHLVFS